jgi:membrane protein
MTGSKLSPPRSGAPRTDHEWDAVTQIDPAATAVPRAPAAPVDPASQTDHLHDVLPPDAGPESSRVAVWRARAERAGTGYQQRAQRQPLLGLPLTFIARYTARQGMLLASACAFRLFLWLLPLALLTAGILAAIASHDTSKALTTASKQAGLTGAASQQIVTALQESHRSWWIAVVTGGVLFLWTTRTLMRNLAVVNAHAWAAPLPKPRQKHVLVTTLVFAGGWVVLAVVGAALTRLDHALGGGPVLDIVLSGALGAGLWFLISQRLPDRRRSWTDLIPGSLLFGYGLAILKVISSVYLPGRFEHSSQLYGPLGIASVMLAWLLIIGQLVVTVALTNAIWSDYREDRRVRKGTVRLPAR